MTTLNIYGKQLPAPLDADAKMLLGSALVYAPITPGASDLPGGACKGIWNGGAAGTANLVQLDNTPRPNFPLQPGWNPVIARAVNAGGTATNLWAMY
jgi:hypothetical protein